MRDADLAALVQRAIGPFPRGLGGDAIDDVDLDLLDDTIMGVSSHYERNSRTLSDEHKDLLIESLRDLDRIYDRLPTATARDYFDRTRAVGQYLLENRAAPA